MAKNHEIRFEVTQEEKELSKNMHKKTASELKRSAFDRKVYLLGIQSIVQKLGDKNINILGYILGNKSKDGLI